MTPSASPITAESLAIGAASVSGMPSMIAMTRAAYGDPKSLTNSQRPVPAKPSISSAARALNWGTSVVTSRGENAGFMSWRSRWCSSPSTFSSQLAHQRANSPVVTPLCAGQATLPWRSFGCLASRLTWSYRRTASP